MRFTTSLTSFRSGRLSPKLYNRVDTKQYRDGASDLVGVKLIPEGGVERMKGCRVYPTLPATLDSSSIRMFNATIKGKSGVFYLIRDTDGYIFLGVANVPNYIPVTGIQIVAAGAKLYDLKLFDWVVFDNTLILTHFDGDFAPRYIDLLINSFTGQISLPLLAGVLPARPDTKIDANGTILNNGVVDDFTRYTNLIFTMPMTDIGEDGRPLTFAHTGGPGSRSFNIYSADPSVTAILRKSAHVYAEGIGYRDFGDGTDRASACGEFFTVTGNFSTTGVTAEAQTLMGTGAGLPLFAYMGITQTTDWAVDEWYEGCYPRTVTINEGRVVFGSTPEKPLTVFGAKLNSKIWFNQHKRPEGIDLLIQPQPVGPTLVNDPYVFTLGNRNDSKFHFLRSTGQGLVIGTDAAEYVGKGADGAILSALSVSFNPYSEKGSDPLLVATGDGAVFYTSQNGKKLNYFKYNRENGSYESRELSLIFSDLLDDDRIVQVEWAPSISSCMLVMESGKLYGLLDGQEASTAAFYDTGVDGVFALTPVLSNNRVADFFPTGSLVYPLGHHLAIYKFETGLCTLEHELYLENVSVSPADPAFPDIADSKAYLYLDKVIIVDEAGAAGTWTWRHTSMLTSVPDTLVPFPKSLYANPFTEDADGDLVAINMMTGVMVVNPEVVDDPEAGVLPYLYVNHPDIVSGGPGRRVLFGIMPKAAQIATMPIEAGQQWGTAQMGIKNIDTIGVRFYKTFSYEISSDNEAWQEERVVTNEGEWRTGRADTKHDANSGTDQIVYLRNRKAEPFCILGINMRGTSNDG